MVAYSVKKRFEAPIRAGIKPHTMRNERTGRVPHVRPGQEMQLYTAMRTKYCRLIGCAICAVVTPVRIHFGIDRVKIQGRPVIKGREALNDFAVTDGFSDWDDLCDFWNEEHSGIVDWSGVLIEWKDFKPEKLEEIGAL